MISDPDYKKLLEDRERDRLFWEREVRTLRRKINQQIRNAVLKERIRALEIVKAMRNRCGCTPPKFCESFGCSSLKSIEDQIGIFGT